MTDPQPAERGREPGNWELMRGIERLEKRFDDAVKGFVSVAVHDLLAARVKDVETDVEKSKTEAAQAVEKAKTEAASSIAVIRTELDNAKKQRAQTWTAIGLLAAGGAVTFLYNLISRGAGLG